MIYIIIILGFLGVILLFDTIKVYVENTKEEPNPKKVACNVAVRNRSIYGATIVFPHDYYSRNPLIEQHNEMLLKDYIASYALHAPQTSDLIVSRPIKPKHAYKYYNSRPTLRPSSDGPSLSDAILRNARQLSVRQA